MSYARTRRGVVKEKQVIAHQEKVEKEDTLVEKDYTNFNDNIYLELEKLKLAYKKQCVKDLVNYSSKTKLLFRLMKELKS